MQGEGLEGLMGEAHEPRAAWRRWAVVALVVLALLARAVLIRQAFVHPDGGMTVDSVDYLDLADSLRLRGEFTTGPGDDFDRVIGYPLFLAAFLSLPADGIETALAAQQILLLAGCVILYVALRWAYGPAVGGAAALWLALSPNSLFWAGTVLSETLASFWLTAGFALVVLGVCRARSAEHVGAGVAVALATLTRPIALYLLPLWTAMLALPGLRRKLRPTALRLAAAFLLAGLVPIGLWVGRNYLVHGQAMVSTVSGRTLRDFQLARVVAEVEGISRNDASALMAAQPDPTGYAIEVSLAHPDVFLKVTALGVVRTLLGTEIGTWMKVLGYTYTGSGMLGALLQGSLEGLREAARNLAGHAAGWLSLVLLAWGGIYSAALLLSVGVGVVRSRFLWRGDRWVPVALALVTVCYLVLIPLGNGDARFRVPAEPFLAFLAALAWRRGGRAVDDAAVPAALAGAAGHHDAA